MKQNLVQDTACSFAALYYSIQVHFTKTIANKTHINVPHVVRQKNESLNQFYVLAKQK